MLHNMSSSNIQHLVDRKGRLWQERTITVIPNKTHGYGFSLSGEKPLCVGSVVDNGPAQQAGIHRNDRIIKVDGSSVFDKKHDEVIVLLKGAASVSLTIIRAISSKISVTKDPSAAAPQVIQELTLNNLKSMLQKQQRHYEQLTIDYTKSPSEAIEQEIKECEEIMRSLMSEMAVKSNSTVETISQTTEGKIGSLLGPEKALERTGRLARDDSMLAHKILSTISDISQLSQATPNYNDDLVNDTTTYSNSKRPNSPSKSYKSPKSSRRSSISKLLTLSIGNNNEVPPGSGNSSPTKGQLQRSLTELNDSDLSDEDLESALPQYGPFSSLQELNNYPAHLSVFLHYLILNKDPRYLCFYLVARSYQNYYKGSELRLKAMEILWTFCLATSPLYVQLGNEALQRILEILDIEDNDIKLKSIFVEARDVVAAQIAEDLTEFRHKRTLGLGSLYGEHKLTDNMTTSREIDVANTTLGKVMKSLSNEKTENVCQINRNQALCDSLTTFLADVGRIKSKSDSTLSERALSFTRFEPKRSKKSKKLNKCGHTLQLTSYTQTTTCDHCDRVLWGVGYHGFQCFVCELNFHRYGCVDEKLEPCKKEKRRTPRKQIAPAPTLFNNFTTTTPLETSEKATATVDKDPLIQSDEQEIPDEEDEHMLNHRRTRLRSVSDPKNILMKVHLEKEEEIVKEQLFTKKTKPSVTVNRTQSLKERTRSGTESGHPHSSQDTSLNTTPSWNSVASSTSDESLNTSTTTSTFGGVPVMTKSSTLDTVIEGDKIVSMEDHIVQELQEANVENELIPWRLSMKSQVVKGLLPFEIQRQELIKEFIHTERTHRKKLLIMKHIYKTPLCRQKIISYQQAEMIFPSLEEIVDIHNEFCDELRVRQAKYSNGVVRKIGDILLSRFEGQAGEKLCKAVSIFASNQSKAAQLLKEFSKEPKFKKFLQDAESDPYCNRLKLQELLPITWTRLTRYSLLIENICKLNRKNKEKIKDEDKNEVELMETVSMCVRNVCKFVNRQVKQAENLRHLREYQSRMDSSFLDKTTHPIAEKFKDLDLTSDNRKLLHEGVLNWKISHRKNTTLEVRALLLTDILVLLSKAEDGSERLLLKMYHSVAMNGAREEISPVIKLKDLMFRDRADKVGRSFFIMNNSSLLKLAQMYEFTVESVQEKKKWEKSIESATNSALQNGSDFLSPELNSPGPDDSYSRPIAFTPLMSNVTLRDQLNKIDEDIQKLMEEKLMILKAFQGDRRDSSVMTLTPPADKDFDGVKDYTCGVLETVSELTNQVSKLMVPNPTKPIVADVQHQLTELSSNLHRNLSHVVMYLNESLGNTPAGLLLERTNISSTENLNDNSERDHFSPVLENKLADSPHYENISDATVSPVEDTSFSNHLTDNTPQATPQATPLPNDSYRLQPVANEDSNPHKNNNNSTVTVATTTTNHMTVLPDYQQHDDDEDDDDNLIPPPLPMEPPPPSSTSASSITTNPDIDDLAPPPPLLPPPSGSLPHSISNLSEEFHVENSILIVQPPDDFTSSSPGNIGRHMFTIAKGDEGESDDDGTGQSSVTNRRSPPKNASPSFRRVRSNPSLSSLKVKMSVLNSSGNPVSSLNNLEVGQHQPGPASAENGSGDDSSSVTVKLKS